MKLQEPLPRTLLFLLLIIHQRKEVDSKNTMIADAASAIVIHLLRVLLGAVTVTVGVSTRKRYSSYLIEQLGQKILAPSFPLLQVGI